MGLKPFLYVSQMTPWNVRPLFKKISQRMSRYVRVRVCVSKTLIMPTESTVNLVHVDTIETESLPRISSEKKRILLLSLLIISVSKIENIHRLRRKFSFLARRQITSRILMKKILKLTYPTNALLSLSFHQLRFRNFNTTKDFATDFTKMYSNKT